MQHNLRNRVSYSSFTLGSNPAQYNQATFYSYDVHGNVDTLLQDYGRSEETATRNVMNANNNRFKKLVYTYDLISGKVNTVAYQAGHPDQFYHRYRYDAENRLTEVSTSSDSVHWHKDARYEYYKHGPLARMVLGDEQVQGVDYAYTLQGWLKGVNSTAPAPEQDMASDGLSSSQYQYVGRDAIGFSLHYYDGDYQAIGDNVNPFPALNADALQGSYRPLYNGNISSMAVSIGKFGNLPLLYNYKYDRLNRLTQMDTWKGFDASANNWSGVQPTDDYKERIAYDGNGNILRYLRNTQNQSQPMDSMRYEYYAGTNRLSHIVDRAPAWIEGIKDIETQPTNNYQYDAIGNLTGDISENIADGGIEWNVYGKITSITKSSAVSGNDTRQIRYSYDASGNRIGKKVTKFGSAEVEYTWYVRDAAGNVLAVYTAKKDTTGDPGLSEFDLTLSEQDVYGSSRLGVRQLSEGVEGNLPAVSIYQHWLGQRRYELGNHLGNILATISDRKTGVADITDGSLTDHYLADVVSAQDYYPFGMLMPGRTFEASGYRYGFNGQEKSNEIKGEGNSYNAEFWEYDTRIGRRWNLDPKPIAGISQYSAFGNSPLWFSDPLGDTIRNYDLARVSGQNFQPNNGGTLQERMGTYTAGEYTINAVYEKSVKTLKSGAKVHSERLLGYYAYRDGQTEYQLDPKDIRAFIANSESFARAANIFYAMGTPSDDQLKYTAGILNGNRELAMEGLKGMWNEAVRNPSWWTAMVSGTIIASPNVAKGSTSLWPAASAGRTVVNGIEYTTHALERMQPVRTIMKGANSYSRGIPPSVVENAIKFGKVTPGNTGAEVVRTFENVRVITNPAGTRVISVFKIGN